MDQPSPGQLSAVMMSGQSQPSMTSTPVPQSIDSEDFDPEITLSQGVKLQETMFPSESQNVTPQETMYPSESKNGAPQETMFPSQSQSVVPQEEAVSAGASDQPGTGGSRLVVSMSDAVAPAEESQLKSQPPSQPQPKSPPKLTPALHPKLQVKSQPKLQAKVQPKLQAKSTVARKRRLLLLLAVIAAMFLIVPAGAFFWWQHYKATPAYQLALLFDAVHRNDKATIDQIVAMDSITDAFASQVTQNVLSQNTSATTDSDRKKLESSVTGLAPSIKETVREEVEKQVRDEAAPSAGKSFLMMALAVPYKVGIKQAGDTATVAAQAHPVSWTMQRSSSGPWTIVAVKDDALASRMQEQVTSELPATGGEKTQSGTSRLKNPPASTQQKNPAASAQQKNSSDSSRARKKERKKPENGITIDLRKIPWPL